MKPVCVKCQRFYRPKKNGAYFIEGMPINGAPPEVSHDKDWVPYKLWCGDLWECQGCGHQLISGVAMAPVSEHYKPDFKEWVDNTQPIVKINDC